MSDTDGDSAFQQIYDWLVLSDAQRTNPFRGGNETGRDQTRKAIERLAAMPAVKKSNRRRQLAADFRLDDPALVSAADW